MDNVTHALVGALAAEHACGWRRRRSERTHRRWRALAYAASIAANNLPDLDALCTGITAGKLGYLLHHRGHTHTLAAAVPIAALVMGATWLFARWRRYELSRSELLGLAVLCALGPLLHLLLDFANSYGVHPLWPFDNRWFYGDAWFILEPLFWISLAVPLSFEVRSRAARAVLGLLAGGIVAAGWLVDLVPWWAMTAVTALAAALAAGSWRRTSGFRIGLATTSFAAAGLLFVGGSIGARRALANGAVALTPMPANPLCWNALQLGADGGSYRIRMATVAPLPSLVPAARCPRRLSEPTLTAPLTEVADRGSDRVAWIGEFRAPLADLRALARTNCHAAAFLRYSRAPFWTDAVIGDLRYDRDPDLGFAEMELPPASAPCPRHVPPWVPPRADLLFAD